jgi:hypothetical protein
MIQNLINHISLVVDKSGSMSGKPVVKVFDTELKRLKQRSVELGQETRISIYLFDDHIECLTFDMDVMRFETLTGHYRLGGSTALIDATLKSIEDHKKLPVMYGDHAFLQYVLTDGQENASKKGRFELSGELALLPDNWTTACLVPNPVGVSEAKKFGFPAESIAIWDAVSSAGLEKAGKQFSTAMDNYMTMRASGVRGTKSFFTMDSSGITRSAASAQLVTLKPSEYTLLRVNKEGPIREYIESWKIPYVIGSAYYQPTKKVKIQDHKNLLIQDVKNGKVYEGDNLRQLLGLPDQTVEVDPGQHKDWRVFVQSTSVNRKLFPNTYVLVRN